MSGTRTDALRRAADRLARRHLASAPGDGLSAPWDSPFFGLDALPRFRQAVTVDRQSILSDCATTLLAEAWRIEHCGITYCARMTLTAESDEERRLFALIGADEAIHADLLAPWIAFRAPPPDPFSRFVAGLAEAGNPQPLAYLLQVVLEGFGIVHFSALAAACRDPTLASTIQRIARDEALHHAGGLAAFNAERLTDADRRFVGEATYAFLQMIRCGPQGVVAALDRRIGIGDHADASRVFASLDAKATSATKLARLRRLMNQPGMEWLIAELERGDAFTPCDAAACARIYLDSR